MHVISAQLAMVLDLIWPSFPDQKGLGPRIVLEHSVREQGNVQTCMEMNAASVFPLSSSLYTALITGPVVACCFFLGNTIIK